MSSRSKGNATEARAVEVLEARGALVHRAVQTGFRAGGIWLSRTNDLFDLFDLLALPPLRPGDAVAPFPLLVQVTTGDGGRARRAKLLARAAEFRGRAVTLELWRWNPGRRSPHTAAGRRAQAFTEMRVAYRLRRQGAAPAVAPLGAPYLEHVGGPPW